MEFYVKVVGLLIHMQIYFFPTEGQELSPGSQIRVRLQMKSLSSPVS